MLAYNLTSYNNLKIKHKSDSYVSERSDLQGL